MILLRESVLEFLRERALARPRRRHVVDPFESMGRTDFRASWVAPAVVAFENLDRLFVPNGIAKGTGLNAHLAANALAIVQVHPARDRVAGQGVRRADRDARRVPTMLAHHRHRKTFALPGVDMHAGRAGTEDALVPHRARKLAIVTPGALVGIDHQHAGHGHSPFRRPRLLRTTRRHINCTARPAARALRTPMPSVTIRISRVRVDQRQNSLEAVGVAAAVEER